MSEALTEVADRLRSSIAELDRERAQLVKALNALEGRGPGRPRRNSRASSNGGRHRKIAPRGLRQRQIKQAISANPGIKAADAAREIGISPTQAYGVIRTLRERGEIAQTADGGYRLSDSATA